MSIFGLCYIHLEEYNKAQTILEKARKQDPFNSLTHISSGNLAFDRQSFGEAYEFSRQALEIDPEAAHAVRNLGILELKQGAEESAARLFQKAHRLEPDNAGHIILLILALKELDDEEGLLAACVKLSRLQPYNPQVKAELGELLLKRGESKEAR